MGTSPRVLSRACPLYPTVTQAVSRINAVLRRGQPEETVEALASPAAQLPEVHAFAAPLYQHELGLLQRQHPQVRTRAGVSGDMSRVGARQGHAFPLQLPA